MNDGEHSEKAKFDLEQRHSLLESVSNNIDAGLAIIDRNYHIIWANKVLRKVGACPGELCYQSIPHAKAVCKDCGVKKIFSQNVPLDVHEYKICYPSGRTVWIELRVTPIKDACGNITSALELAVPITERKKAQEELSKSQAELQAIFEASPDSTFLLDQNYRFTRVNRLSFEPRLKEVLIGKDSRDYVAPEYRNLATKKIDECFVTGIKQEFEHRMPNGRYVVSRIVPVRSESTNRQVLVITTDITERVVLEKQVQEKERLAAIGATAGMVGHDIRNPLQAIAGDLYLIDNDVASLSEGKIKEGLQESVKSIQGNLFYIAKIVEDLQDYAKPLKPNFERIRAKKVIEEVMLLMTSVTPNHRVVIDVEAGFPEIVTDFSMLKRALTNLTQNALQAMPDGGQLTLRANHKDTRVFISVEDTGEGIPEEVKLKLFTPMVTTKSKGQGLGLAVVKRLVEALNGTVTFESQLGKGTKFTIELPTS